MSLFNSIKTIQDNTYNLGCALIDKIYDKSLKDMSQEEMYELLNINRARDNRLAIIKIIITLILTLSILIIAFIIIPEIESQITLLENANTLIVQDLSPLIYWRRAAITTIAILGVIIAAIGFSFNRSKYLIIERAISTEIMTRNGL